MESSLNLDSLACCMQAAYQKLHSELTAKRNALGHWTGELSVSALSTATAVSALSVARTALIHPALNHRPKEPTPTSPGSDSNLNSASRLNPAELTHAQPSPPALPLLALEKYHPKQWDVHIEQGCDWLVRAQNADGGFGDTDRSISNIATTLLVLAAWDLAGVTSRYTEPVAQARHYVQQSGHWDGLRKRYGKDKTFVVPIMTNCALAGQMAWKEIPTLPFEAAALPQSWYRFAKMPVVSYAVPALVAIGQAQLAHSPPSNPIVRSLRKSVRQRTLQVLQKMQPESGGYLEATPLTSFVLMNLASIGLVQHSVCQNAIRFIIDSVTSDGSWPIDTNLATWVTSLTTKSFYPKLSPAKHTSEQHSAHGLSHPNGRTGINSQPTDTNNQPSTAQAGMESAASVQVQTLENGEAIENAEPPEHAEWGKTIDWLLSCQHLVRHPFTGAEPGGWGWTNLSGSVPDSDDTPAALLALHAYYSRSTSSTAGAHQQQASLKSASNSPHGGAVKKRRQSIQLAAERGCQWLLRLQNSDGGWPTFCRGWGTLPFDRSGSDLTAHAIRALHAWKPFLPPPLQSRIERSMANGWRYLGKRQAKDGSWEPLWFGNQDREDEDNPFYGTARVLLAFADCAKTKESAAQAAIAFLKRHQNPDGSWGGGKSICYPPQSDSVQVPELRRSQPAVSTEQHFSAPNGNATPFSQVGSPSLSVNLAHSGTGTLEETAVVLEALISCSGKTIQDDSIMKGIKWVCDAVDGDYHRVSQPIGFYFAKLWYHEKQYPLAFSLAALRKGLELCQ